MKTKHILLFGFGMLATTMLASTLDVPAGTSHTAVTETYEAITIEGTLTVPSGVSASASTISLNNGGMLIIDGGSFGDKLSSTNTIGKSGGVG